MWKPFGCCKRWMQSNGRLPQRSRRFFPGMWDTFRILNELNDSFSGRNDVVDRLCGHPLLIIDDFGMERGTEYALEQIYNIVDSRYRSRKPLIVTTNLTLEELKNPQSTAHARIMTVYWKCARRLPVLEPV